MENFELLFSPFQFEGKVQRVFERLSQAFVHGSSWCGHFGWRGGRGLSKRGRKLIHRASLSPMTKSQKVAPSSHDRTT